MTTPAAAQDAYLRTVFVEAAESFCLFELNKRWPAGWKIPPDCRTPEQQLRHAWRVIYECVRDTDNGGVEVLKQLQLQGERIQELENRVGELESRDRPTRLTVAP